MSSIFKLVCVVGLITLTLSSWAQERSKVRGLVTDQSGAPISGVTVSVEATAQMIATGADGRYVLSAGPSDVLVFTSLGYAQRKETVGNRTTINVTLEAGNSALDEVVVVGYGTQKRVNLTSSVSTIDKKQLESRALTNPLAALQGAAPGLVVTRGGGQPGAEGFKVNIRGELSTGGAAPLVLIDGVPGSIEDTNPGDIESISVLKDASATAIYGSRGAGGVMLVTTKQGSGKPRVNFQGMWTMKRIGLFPEVAHSWEEAEMQNEAMINGGRNASWTEEMINLLKDPNIEYRVNPDNPKAYQYLGDYDHSGMLLRDQTPRYNSNFSISGSDENENYLFSLGHMKDQGMWKVGPDAATRLTSRFNYERKLSEQFSIESRLLYSKSDTESPVGGSSGDYGLLNKILSISKVTPVFLPESNDQLYAAGSAAGQAYAILKEGSRREARDDEFAGTIALQGRDLFTKGFNLRASYSPRILLRSIENKERPVPTYDLGGQIGFAGPMHNKVAKDRERRMTNNVQFLAEFGRTFNDRHELLARAGYRYDDYRYDALSASASNLPTDDVLALKQATSTENTTVGDNIQTNALISFFGTAQYVFDTRYIVQATLNHEASSRLSPQTRWITLPGLSAGWRLVNESWFPKGVFQELKLRAAWGKQANDPGSSNPNSGNYDHITMLSGGSGYPFNNSRTPYYYQDSPASPLRKWESITNTDVGLDFRTLRERLSGSLSYFWRTTDGTYATLLQPAVYGMANPVTNLGVFKSWGWEVTLSWSDKIGSEFSYFISGNVADNDNRVESYLDRNTLSTGQVGLLEGYAKNSIFGYISDGYFQSQEEVEAHADQQFARTGPGDLKYRDVNGDGIISVGRGTLDDMGDLVFLGTSNPRYQYGITLGFSYKGIDFSAMLQGIGKRSYLLPEMLLMPYLSNWREGWAIHRDHWTPENRDAMFPRMYIGGQHNVRTSSKWVVNGAYTRLKNVQLGYTLPAAWTSKAHINKLRVFVSGDDLWEATKAWHPHYDPETPDGQDYGYPFFRTVTFGINVTLQ